MIHSKSRILGLLMAMVMLVTMTAPAMATEAGTKFVSFGDTNLSKSGTLEKLSDLDVEARAGRVFLTGLEVYAYRSSDDTVTIDPVASGYWTANTFPNVTVPRSTFDDCANYGCDYWLVYMNFTVEGSPSRLAIYVNDSAWVEQAIYAGSFTWDYSVPFSRSTQQFRLTLDGTGASSFGNIYIG